MATLAAERPTLEFEQQLLAEGHLLLAGVDEVGRGSLAGPVVAAAIILPLDQPDLLESLDGVRDSKQLTPDQRQETFQRILDVQLAVGLGWSSHHVIDRDGLAHANRRAMLRAVQALDTPPDALLLDAFPLRDSPLPQLPIIKGDSRSLSIAAASIVAKVVRDRWMTRYSHRFPDYGFDRHKGYATRSHLAAIDRLGPSPIHRMSFAPLTPRLL